LGCRRVGPFLAILGCLEVILGPSMAVSGLSWGNLELSCGILVPTCHQLGAYWGNLGHRGAILGPSWACWGHLGAILALSWAILGAILESSWPSWVHLRVVFVDVPRVLGGLGRFLGDVPSVLGGLGRFLGDVPRVLGGPEGPGSLSTRGAPWFW
jgi:hypothetical protein